MRVRPLTITGRGRERSKHCGGFKAETRRHCWEVAVLDFSPLALPLPSGPAPHLLSQHLVDVVALLQREVTQPQRHRQQPAGGGAHNEVKHVLTSGKGMGQCGPVEVQGSSHCPAPGNVRKQMGWCATALR